MLPLLTGARKLALNGLLICSMLMLGGCATMTAEERVTYTEGAMPATSAWIADSCSGLRNEHCQAKSSGGPRI